jgi:hypothetical protein
MRGITIILLFFSKVSFEFIDKINTYRIIIPPTINMSITKDTQTIFAVLNIIDLPKIVTKIIDIINIIELLNKAETAQAIGMATMATVI